MHIEQGPSLTVARRRACSTLQYTKDPLESLRDTAALPLDLDLLPGGRCHPAPELVVCHWHRFWIRESLDGEVGGVLAGS